MSDLQPQSLEEHYRQREEYYKSVPDSVIAKMYFRQKEENKNDKDT